MRYRLGDVVFRIPRWTTGPETLVRFCGLRPDRRWHLGRLALLAQTRRRGTRVDGLLGSPESWGSLPKNGAILAGSVGFCRLKVGPFVCGMLFLRVTLVISI